MSLTLLELQSSYGDISLKIQVVYPQNGTAVLKGLTRLELQSRHGDRSLKIQVGCPQNGTAVLYLVWVTALRHQREQIV